MNSPASFKQALRQFIIQHFSLEEFKTVCFDLPDVKFDSLPGDTLEGKARELIALLEREGRLQELLVILQESRPQTFPGLLSKTSITPHNLLQRPVIVNREEVLDAVMHSIVEWPITTIFGGPGYGKTVLAVEAGYRSLAEERFEAVIWTTAKGTSLSRTQIANAILKTCGIRGALRLPEDEKIQVAYDVLRSTQCLLIVDNLETIEDMQVFSFIEEVPDPSHVLTTTRRLIELQAERVINLRNMSPSEALLLVQEETKRLGLPSSRVDSPDMLSELVDASFGNPLAIKWAVGQVKYKGKLLSRVVRKLQEGEEDLLFHLFGGSWNILPRTTRRILMALALFPEPTTTDAIEFATELDSGAARHAISQLVGMSLVELENPLEELAYYTVHPLTRAFAVQQTRSDTLLEERVRLRMAEYYADFLKQEQAALYRLDVAYERIDAELNNILGALAWCHSEQHVEIEIKIVDNLARFLWNRGYWDLRLDIIQRTLANLDIRVHANVLSRFCCYIAWVFSRRGQQETALAWVERAKEYTTGDKALESGFVEHVLGQIDFRASHFQAAEVHMLRALEIYHEQTSDQLENLIAIADVWDNLGDLNRDWGLWLHERDQLPVANQRFHESMRWYKKLLQFAETKQWIEKMATASGDLGHVALYLGRYEEAAQYLDLGLRYATVLQRKHTIAYCHLGFGQLFVTRGLRHHDKAVSHLHTAMTIYKELGQQDVARQISDVVDELHRPWYIRLLYRFRRRRWIRY